MFVRVSGFFSLKKKEERGRREIKAFKYIFFMLELSSVA